MKIVSWNVNGIRSAYGKGLLESLRQIDAEIVCLQETRANADEIPCEFKGYSSFFNSSKQKGRAGVAVLSRKKPLEVASSFANHDAFDGDGRVLKLRFPEFTLFNLYFPHGGRDKSSMPFKFEMYSAFFEELEKLRKSESEKAKDKNIIVCGDFNIAHSELDLARPKENAKNTMFTPEERAQLDKLEGTGFVDTFRQLHPSERKYSWWPYYRNARERNLGWRIDYIFASKALAGSIRNAFILNEVPGSDHCPVGIELR